jgi:hypothetical protein
LTSFGWAESLAGAEVAVAELAEPGNFCDDALPGAGESEEG